MASRRLTGKQAAFVRWYTTPGDTMYNATESARRAQYSGNDNALAVVGHNNLRNTKIQREINRIVLEQFDQVDLTVESVIAKLEQHRLISVRNQDMGAANKALEMQGKYLKMFADRVEHVHSVEDATEDELVALLNELIGKVNGFDVASITALLGGGEAGSGSNSHSEGTPTTH